MLKRVYLEITNACNLNCPFCTNKKGNNYLPYDDIKNYILQIKPFCNYIYLHILGEPLLHPDFNRILDFLDENDMFLQLVSNGTLLSKYKDILNHKCLRKFSISLHSINNVEISNNYFLTIDELISKDSNTKIELRFYDKNNLDENLSKYLNSLKNKYNFNITAKTNSYEIKKNTYVYFEELFKWPNIQDPYISNVGTCRGAIDMIAINSNSDVTICCLDPYAYNKIGNLKQNTLSEILNSDIYLNYVKDFKTQKINSVLCSKCTYRLKF